MADADLDEEFAPLDIKCTDTDCENNLHCFQKDNRSADPLRVVPLEVQVFTPVRARLTPVRRESLVHQQRAVEAWTRELERRFPAAVRSLQIVDVPMK